MKLTAAIGAILIMATLSNGPAAADVTPAHVFSDHMVLQRGMPIPIWGWAEPGEPITVRCAGNEATTTAAADGTWLVKLPEMKAGGPYEITIQGKNTITLTDVLVGEVWLASGQSNMEMGLLAVANGEAECAAADHPNIRLFYVPQRPTGQPMPDVESAWKHCTPETVRQGKFQGFSAAAYYFGLELQKELDVPIGLIDSTWGGTRIEPWMPAQAFALNTELEPLVKEIDDANNAYTRDVANALDPLQQWIDAARRALDEDTDIPIKPRIPENSLGTQFRPTGLYNGMIHPLARFAIRGVLWYQGESNVNPYDEHYTIKMQAMVQSWRDAWGEGDFPFYYVQIAPFNLRLFIPDIDTELPVLIREQQLEAMALIPNCGMVVTSDIGDLRDIHPKNKVDVGKRLALWALANTYGRKGIVYSGPIYKGMTVEHGAVRVTFDHVGGGLASRDGKPLTHFEIAGKDKVWHPAGAKIDADSVVVACDAVPEPVAVRFGWHMTAEPNLMNKEGLPAAQFRSHKW